MAVGNANLMKQINLNSVRHAIRQARTATKSQLSKLTGLSVVTINSLVETLLTLGELQQVGIEETSTGRPAAVFSFNERFSLALIVYANELVYMDMAVVAVVNLHGEVIDLLRIPFDKKLERAVESAIVIMLDKHPSIRSIGIGLPGQVVHGQIEAVDFAEFDGKTLADRLGDRFGIPILLENDVNAAVLGHCTTNHCTEQIVVGIYIPEKYPLGIGIFIHGGIFRGKDGFAGEAKYLQDGLDWSNPAAVTENISLALKKLIITITCLFNPDRLVIYRKNLTPAVIESVLQECRAIIRSDLLPEVILSDHFQDDFANGIKQITLQPLLPRVD